jgi:hypothetical protein
VPPCNLVDGLVGRRARMVTDRLPVIPGARGAMNPLEPAASEAVNAVDLPLAAVPDPGLLAQDFTAEDLPSL